MMQDHCQFLWAYGESSSEQETKTVASSFASLLQIRKQKLSDWLVYKRAYANVVI